MPAKRARKAPDLAGIYKRTISRPPRQVNSRSVSCWIPDLRKRRRKNVVVPVAVRAHDLDYLDHERQSNQAHRLKLSREATSQSHSAPQLDRGVRGRAKAFCVTDESVLLPLPNAGDAPGIRDGIREWASWRLNEVTPGWALVEPGEGAHKVSPYFKARKLCDAQTEITPQAFEPIRRNPAWPREGLPGLRTSPNAPPDPNWEKVLIDWANSVAAPRSRPTATACPSSACPA